MSDAASAPSRMVSYPLARGQDGFTWQGPAANDDEALARAARALAGAWRLCAQAKKPHKLGQPTIMEGRGRPGLARWSMRGALLCRGTEIKHPGLSEDLRPVLKDWGAAILAGDPASDPEDFRPDELSWKGRTWSLNAPTAQSSDESVISEVTGRPSLRPETAEALLAATFAAALQMRHRTTAQGMMQGANPIVREDSATLAAAGIAQRLRDRAGSRAAALERLEALGFREVAKAYGKATA